MKGRSSSDSLGESGSEGWEVAWVELRVCVSGAKSAPKLFAPKPGGFPHRDNGIIHFEIASMHCQGIACTRPFDMGLTREY